MFNYYKELYYKQLKEDVEMDEKKVAKKHQTKEIIYTKMAEDISDVGSELVAVDSTSTETILM